MIMLSVVILNVVMLIVVMLNVVMLSVIMPMSPSIIRTLDLVITSRKFYHCADRLQPIITSLEKKCLKRVERNSLLQTKFYNVGPSHSEMTLMFLNLRNTKGATPLSILTLSITTLSIITLSIITFGITIN
jgi:hypothetical protein